MVNTLSVTLEWEPKVGMSNLYDDVYNKKRLKYSIDDKDYVLYMFTNKNQTIYIGMLGIGETIRSRMKNRHAVIKICYEYSKNKVKFNCAYMSNSSRNRTDHMLRTIENILIWKFEPPVNQRSKKSPLIPLNEGGFGLLISW